MSRRGNCWDNAPQESFFGHMKDEIVDRIRFTKNYEEIKLIIDERIDYYNNDRSVSKLNKMSPTEKLNYAAFIFTTLDTQQKNVFLVQDYLKKEKNMITAKSLQNKELFELLQEYRRQFKEQAFTVEMSTGNVSLPSNVTEEELIVSLKKCIKENIKLYEIYPSLIDDDDEFDPNKKI